MPTGRSASGWSTSSGGVATPRPLRRWWTASAGSGTSSSGRRSPGRCSGCPTRPCRSYGRRFAARRWLARLQATHTLSKVGRFDDAELLVPLVADPVDCVAARAYWAVAQCREPAVVPALLAELSRGDAEHQHLMRADVPADVLEQVRADAHARASASGKADALAVRIAAGWVEQFVHERVFVEQVRVTDPGGTVDDLLRGKDIRIVDFVRLPPVPFEV